jgi:signal transduction histidine kinase
MVVNPRAEIYLLDPKGSVLAYSAPPSKVRQRSVRLDPIRRYIGGDENYPLYGDDPRHPERPKVFSAAPVSHGGTLLGYIYVVLGGDRYTSVMQMYSGSYTLQASAAWLGLGLLFALCTGLGLFAHLTARLRRLSGVIAAFSEGGGETRLPPPSRWGGDEIDRLTAGFNAMAERISEQMENLRRKDRLRRELVANVSHDLRTPLASLGGHLETLVLKEKELSSAEQRRYLDTALRAAERLNRLVGELFELAKLEAAETRPTPEAFALPELVQDVVQKLEMRAQNEGVRLVQRFASGTPFVWADIGLIERVLENLLTNALRHTPPGGSVEVTVGHTDGQVTVRVEDTGSGIPDQDLPHIFERSYQPASERQSEGAGLGLAIVQRILELHGSRIAARNRERSGSVFSFELLAWQPAAS